ncbi:MAG: MBG domain-containing protein [Sulfuritalea sp.]|nr:MBG domain-containing protein [Sulfuritalea sp.]MDP1982571.1 MBG domain-containing protein [Sulfuritalea sp.]
MMRIFKPRQMVCAVAALFAQQAMALPAGVQIGHGSASIAQNGNALTITNSPGAILNWQGFSIGASETVRFIQQSAQSAVLNRVVGQSPSAILGSLQSNGRVFLVNPNGIVFGQGARIDVAGLVASSLNITDADFLAGKHNYLGSASSGAVGNQGNIATTDGGLVYLIAPDVNNSGIVTAPNGDILLAAGHSVTIAPAAEPDVRVRIAAPANGEAVNVGQLIARSGAVGIHGVNVTQGGTIDASTAVAGANGRIYLKAEKTLLAKAGSTTLADGGDITLTSGALTTVEKGAKVQADDGRINLWSDGDTHANGSFRARNGFLETSGNHLDVDGIEIDAAGGEWLIDPGDVTITASGVDCSAGGTCAVAGASTNINAATIVTALNSNTSVTIDTVAGAGGNGDILVNANIGKTTAGAATLTLNADRNLAINSGKSISATTGTLDVVLSANRTVPHASNGIILYAGASVSTNGGSFSASGSNMQMPGSTSVNTSGGPLSITATHAAGSVGFSLGGTLQSGGGHISLASSSSGAGMQLYGTIDAGAGYVTLNLPNGGTATTYASGSKVVTSGLELLGNNANYHIGGAPQWVGWTGDSVNAPGAAVFNSAQAGNPVLAVAGSLTGTSTVYLYAGTPNVAYVSGNGMNTDISVGSVGGSNGLNATYVYLTTANGRIVQTQKITATDLYANAYSIVQGNTVDLAFAAGNGVTNLKASGAMCYASNGCTVGPSPTPSFQFTNALALNIAGTVDAGNGAAVIKTLAGNLTIQSAPAMGTIKSRLAGTAADYANAIILVAGANTAADFINSSSVTPLQSLGASSRYLIYSKDASSISLGGLAGPAYAGSSNGGYTAYFGNAFHASPYNGGGLPAAPASAALPNAIILKNQPTLTVTANAAARNYGDANPAFTYGVSGLVLGDTAGGALSGSLSSAATVASNVGSYAITQSGFTSPTGYNINYTGANLTVGQRPLSIAADAKTKVVGAVDPVLTYQVSAGSVANGDVLNLNRTAGESVGAYPINLGANPNYSVTYIGSNLSITSAPAGGGSNAASSAAPNGDVTRAVILTNRPDSATPALTPAPNATLVNPAGGSEDVSKPSC